VFGGAQRRASASESDRVSSSVVLPPATGSGLFSFFFSCRQRECVRVCVCVCVGEQVRSAHLFRTAMRVSRRSRFFFFGLCGTEPQLCASTGVATRTTGRFARLRTDASADLRATVEDARAVAGTFETVTATHASSARSPCEHVCVCVCVCVCE